jgi:hypothetical protein
MATFSLGSLVGRRRFGVAWALVAAGASFSACADVAEEEVSTERGELAATADEALALRHAPVHYQDTDSTDARADYLTRVDFDGNLRSDDNWDHLPSGSVAAHVYYSVVESCTHWFVVYGFFHPRDWSDTAFDGEHENDMEGVLAAIRKDGTAQGKLEAAVTVFHTDFFSYKAPGTALTAGEENVDGTLSLQTFEGVGHFKTSQQAKGHGLKAWPFTGDFDGSSGQDGIIYFPSSAGVAEAPSGGNDRDVRYKLVDFFAGLWPAQFPQTSSNLTYASWGTFRGNDSGGCGSGTKSCSTNSANTPWGWDDQDDGSVFKGELALDPAHVIDHYFNGLGEFGTTYVRNAYLSDLRARGFTSANRPPGFPSQIDLDALYAKLQPACP